jgi:hypothetical protein
LSSLVAAVVVEMPVVGLVLAVLELAQVFL